MMDRERFERLNEIRKHNDEDFNLTKESVDFLLDEIDQLRSANYYNESAMSGARSLLAPVPGDVSASGVQTPPQGKTVRVSAMVAVDSSANWCAYGRSRKNIASHPSDANCALMGMSPFSKVYRLTATLPVPQEVEVVAEVEDE